MPSIAADSRRNPSSGRGVPRPIPAVHSLDSLIGAHPAALCDIYGSGQPAATETFREALRVRLLAFELGADSAFMVSRRIVKLLERWLPWKGKSFASDGTSGINRVLSWRRFPFRCEAGRSAIDGQPTMFLRYSGLGNPFPLSRLVDELRLVGDGIGIGPASYLTSDGTAVVLFWWGIEQVSH